MKSDRKIGVSFGVLMFTLTTTVKVWFWPRTIWKTDELAVLPIGWQVVLEGDKDGGAVLNGDMLIGFSKN